MNKNYFHELALYNIWANQLLCDWIKELSDDQWSLPLVSSFGSIADTVIHIAGAERIWLERLNRFENPVWLPSVFDGNRNDAMHQWQEASVALADFVSGLEDQTLTTHLSFRRINGDAYVMLHYEVLAHVFNHSTYHRGQLITMLRQAGYTQVESTDLLRFYRETKQA